MTVDHSIPLSLASDPYNCNTNYNPNFIKAVTDEHYNQNLGFKSTLLVKCTYYYMFVSCCSE